MFFVAYFISAQSFVVIPTKWVKKHAEVMEKATNRSINSNQAVANFHHRIADELQMNDDFCFFARIVKYFGNDRSFSR